MEKPKAVVVGSGFGGLALAVRLQSGGFQTTLLEQRDKLGGRAYVYEDQGFIFDGGPTVITDPTALEELFSLSGRKMSDYVEMIPVMPFYRLSWEDGQIFDYSNEQEVLEKQIADINPADVEGYRRFLAYSKEVLEEGYNKLGAVPFLEFKKMIEVAPQLMKLESYRSVYSMVAKFVKNERLRQVFSFHSLLVGGNPFETSSIYTLIHALEREWGVFFPRGGTGALVRGIARLFEDLGGRIRLSTPVEEIVTVDGKVREVRCGDGSREPCDFVGSNADVVHTYGKLLKNTKRGQQAAKSLSRRRFSMSLFVVYFGLKGTYPDLRHHMILFGPRYRELIRDIFKAPKLADDFSLYLHVPTVTDPSLAPEGCSSFYVLSPVPHLGTADLDWEVEGPKYRDRILEYLEQHAIPGLRENLVTSRIFTPFNFRDELNAHHGSAFSLEPILRQSAWFRVHNRDDAIQGLYFVGAGTHPGAGVPGVVASAKATAGIMLEDAGLTGENLTPYASAGHA